MHPSRLIALLLSATLHLAVFAPGALAWHRVDEAELDLQQPPLDLSDPDDDEGELPIEPLPDVPFHVSLYVEPVPVASALTAAAAAPTAVPVVDVPVPALALPLPAEVVVAVPAPDPEPPVAPEPTPEPVLSDADRAALAEMEKGEATGDAPAADDDGEAFEAEEARKRLVARTMRRERTRTERNNRRAPCPESSQSIARVDEGAWYIDRDLIEYYATHMAELQKLGSVWTHRDADGDLDGFRVGLARCSVLRQGGLHSGDIVHDINGRRIHSVLQAIGAYIALRAEPELFVRITRKGQPLVLAYTIEQPARGKEARAARRAARQAARKPAESQAAR